MATDKHGNTLMRGDTVMLATNKVAQVAEPLTNTAVVTSVISEEINPSTCAVIATVDGRAFATQVWVPPVSPAPPGSSDPILISETFENGISTSWAMNLGFSAVPHPQSATIVSNPRQGMCGLVHYEIPATGAAHQDDNKALVYRTPTPKKKLSISADVLIPANVPLRGATRPIQRKLLYFKSNHVPDGQERPAFWAALSSECLDPAHDYITLRYGFAATMFNDIARIYRGRWTHIDAVATANDPNQTNGTFSLRIDYGPEILLTGIDYRYVTAGAQDNFYQFHYAEVGQQADRINNDPVSEDRYWDNIEIR